MSLQKIQERLSVPKNQYNAFGKYKYRSLEDILEALKPLLAEHGYHLIVEDHIEEIGSRVYVRAEAVLYDSDKTTIGSSVAYAREPESKKGMDESQITGAASSYARKYCLNGLFAIDDTKDADATETHGKDTAKPVDLVALKKDVQVCKTESDLTDLWTTYEEIITAASNKAEAIQVFSKRKAEMKAQGEATNESV